MESTLSRNVNDLSEAERRAFDEMLGRPLKSNERLFIMAYTPNTAPDESAREAAVAGLQRTFNKVDEYAAARGISPEEAETAFEEAMQQARSRKC